MKWEHVDRRVLGAIRFLDVATGLPVPGPLSIAAEGVRFVRNRIGWYVITGAPGLEAHTTAFLEPPDTPALGSKSLTVTIDDPTGRYLARRCTIRLPRDPDPGRADREDSLFRPIDVLLFPSPMAATSPGWSAIRATVTVAGSVPPRPLRGVLIRVVRSSNGEVLGMGMTDSRGEALVAVPGIPVTTWEEGTGPVTTEIEGTLEPVEEETGSVLTTEIEVALEIVFDPKAGDFPDPDDLEAGWESLPRSAVAEKLASGRVLVRALTIALPP